MKRHILLFLVMTTLACEEGQAIEDVAEPTSDAIDAFVPSADSVNACSGTCGSGPVYVLDRVSFSGVDADGVSRGFDLDHANNGCGVMDLESPDGRSGIDNRLGELLGVVPASASDALPGIIQSAIDSGAMSILLEPVGIDGFESSIETFLVVRQGGGDVLQGADGHILAGQTYTLQQDFLLGVAPVVHVGGGALVAPAFPLKLRLTYLGSELHFRLFQAQLDVAHDPTDDSLEGLLGGMVPLEDALGLVALLGGDDTDLRELLEGLLPGFVDSSMEADGSCDALSVALRVHAVRAFIL